MTQVREHRGSLAESMATVREVADRAELVALIQGQLLAYGYEVADELIRVEPYRYDLRLDWATYLITVDGYGVWGMSKGPL